MQEIFDKSKGREWDWFGLKGNMGAKEVIYITDDLEFCGCKCDECDVTPIKKSLADLLANKSWCIAVWGDGLGKNMLYNWAEHSLKAFQILQRDGHDAAIIYINQTMI